MKYILPCHNKKVDPPRRMSEFKFWIYRKCPACGQHWELSFEPQRNDSGKLTGYKLEYSDASNLFDDKSWKKAFEVTATDLKKANKGVRGRRKGIRRV